VLTDVILTIQDMLNGIDPAKKKVCHNSKVNPNNPNNPK
jgi:hypothetical protein